MKKELKFKFLSKVQLKQGVPKVYRAHNYNIDQNNLDYDFCHNWAALVLCSDGY